MIKKINNKRENTRNFPDNRAQSDFFKRYIFKERRRRTTKLLNFIKLLKNTPLLQSSSNTEYEFRQEKKRNENKKNY